MSTLQSAANDGVGRRTIDKAKNSCSVFDGIGAVVLWTVLFQRNYHWRKAATTDEIVASIETQTARLSKDTLGIHFPAQAHIINRSRKI